MQQKAAFAAIKETLSLMDDWEDRYAYLIDLARDLPAYPADLRDEAHKVPGCTSQVWMVHRWDGDRLFMHIDSDAILVKGLLAVLMALYDGRTATEIAGDDPAPHFAELGLESNLSPNRRNGFFAVASRVRQLAAAHHPG